MPTLNVSVAAMLTEAPNIPAANTAMLNRALLFFFIIYCSGVGKGLAENFNQDG
jgi:hypothetical protein